jgi:hypothetical protein
MGHPSFMEEHGLGAFENGAVHGMCAWIDKPLVIKMEKLHNKKYHSSYILRNIIWVTHAQYKSCKGK